MCRENRRRNERFVEDPASGGEERCFWRAPNNTSRNFVMSVLRRPRDVVAIPHYRTLQGQQTAHVPRDCLKPP